MGKMPAYSFPSFYYKIVMFSLANGQLIFCVGFIKNNNLGTISSLPHYKLRMDVLFFLIVLIVLFLVTFY